MFSSFVASLGLVANEPRPLVLRDGLRAPASLARAQVTTRATALAADGVTWTEFAADQPRFHDVARRLLIEGQRMNAVRNPRAEGAAAPSTLPTNWVFDGAGTGSNGLALTVVGSGTANGIDYIVVEIAGTATSTVGRAINFETPTGIAAAAGETWTGSLFVALEPGFDHVLAQARGQLRLLAPGSALADHMGTSFTPSEAWQRVAVTRSLPAGTTSLQPRIRIGAASVGAVIATRWRIGWPSACQAAFLAAPILPLAGTLGASLRGADLITAPLTALGIGGNGACTLLWSGMVPQATPSGVNQTLLQIDGGSNANRVVLRRGGAGGVDLFAVPVTGGVEGAAASAGSVLPGVPFRIGLALDGAGRIAVSLNGATAVAVGGAPTAGLSTLRLGNNAAGTEALLGEVAAMQLRPYALSDVGLVTAVAAMPG